MDVQNVNVSCPICDNSYPPGEIEEHANKCIFLNSTEEKQTRKRPPSPILGTSSFSQPKFTLTQRSPRDPAKNVSTATAISGRSKSKSLLNKPSNIDTLDPSEEAPSMASQPPNINFKVPLAVQVRPKSLDEFFGQSQVLGDGTVLRSLIEKSDVPNMILWGPPGCGKTSLAHVIQKTCKSNRSRWKFVSLCATDSGIKQVQEVVALAKNDLKFGKRTVLFMDEIHRFNKKQQDVFLASVEKGDIALIGATTENPSFAINGALLSRCKVVVFEKLTADEVYRIVENASNFCNIPVVVSDEEKAMNTNGLKIEQSALKWLADISDGDARIALSNLQLVLSYFNQNSSKTITVDEVEDKIKRGHMLYDRAGEEHYNIISAMHKSIRGSDENAALYWTTRMIVSGEDPKYIARRMVRAASEDIGNADPHALPLAIATMQGCQLIGMPEADVLLAQCAIYLARAPKSREADTALARAKQLIAEHKGPQPSVPMQIRNAPTKLMKSLGYGKLPEGAEFTFMPPEYKDVDFFD